MPSPCRLPASAPKAQLSPAQLPGQLLPPGSGLLPAAGSQCEGGISDGSDQAIADVRPQKNPFVFLRLLPNVVLRQGKVPLGGLKGVRD